MSKETFSFKLLLQILVTEGEKELPIYLLTFIAVPTAYVGGGLLCMADCVGDQLLSAPD